MGIQRSAVLVPVLALTTATALGAQAGASFGPKRIYLRGSALAWQFPIEQTRDELFAAAEAAGAEQGLEVLERDEQAEVLRLVRTGLAGKALDRLCRYPIVSYYSWKPVESFAMAQARAMRERLRGESSVEAALLRGSVHVSVRTGADGSCVVQSLCSVYLRDWGLLETGSRGVLEKAFLEELTAGLGRPTAVALPDTTPLEPSRENPTRDLEEARHCLKYCRPGRPCAGIYVDPQTRELRCVEPRAAPG